MFSLSKWYLDCVTDIGDTSIVYTGEVVWGALRLHYTSLLENEGLRTRERHSLRKQPPPQIKNGCVYWEAHALKAGGEWRVDSAQSRQIGIEKSIFHSPQGSIEWHCLAPHAIACVGKRSGLGYAEHLEMTIPPWKLPIQRLRWGRFISDSYWMVWIDWQGENSRRIVYANGQELHAPVVEDGQIELANGARLTMDRSLVLRDGPLGTTALGHIPGIRQTFPVRLLQVRECKWRSLGRLEWPGEPATQGWIIHERVEWPK